MDDQPYDVVASARRAALVALPVAAVDSVMLQSHERTIGGAWNPGLTGDQQLFSWAHWILVLLLLLCAAGLLSARRPGRATLVAAAGLVPACMLAGAGIVARRRWHPVAGPGLGIWTNQRGLVLIATVGALAALLAVLALLHVLWTVRRLSGPAIRPTSVRIATVALAAATALSGPYLVALGRPGSHDLTSRGAFGLLWSLPWGAMLALTGWLPRKAAVAVGLTVAASAASAFPRCDIVHVQYHVIPVLIGVVSGLLGAAIHTSSRRTARTLPGEPAPR